MKCSINMLYNGWWYVCLGGSLYGAMANMLDSNILVREFKLQLHYSVHFQTNNKNSLILLAEAIILLRTPTHIHVSFNQPAKTYLHQLFVDTGCSLKYVPGVMDDRKLSAVNVTSWWWWWWWWVKYYHYCSSTRMGLALNNPQRILISRLKGLRMPKDWPRVWMRLGHYYNYNHSSWRHLKMNSNVEVRKSVKKYNEFSNDEFWNNIFFCILTFSIWKLNEYKWLRIKM